MKRVKKWISLVLVICLALSMLPVTAAGTSVVASGSCGYDTTWTLDSGGTLTISGEGVMGDYWFSSMPWYDYLSQIVTVKIDEGVTTIGDYAFYECVNLTSVSIPDSVVSIGRGAFYYCESLTGVVIPDQVTSIGNNAFYGCESLTSVTIPDSVTSVGSSVFAACSGLTRVDLGNGLTYIGDSMFSWCDNLTGIVIPDSVVSIGRSAFDDCSALRSVSIGSGVTTIGDSAFFWCDSLTDITIPASVTSIGTNVFYGCPNLTGIWVDEANPSYCSDSAGVLYNKSKTELIRCPGTFSGTYVIPESVSQISESAFSDCTALTAITIGLNVESIGDSAFYGCTGLTGVYISDLKAWCEIDSGSYANPLQAGGKLYLNGQTLVDVEIPAGTTQIGNYAFFSCTDLKNVTIPDSVTSIGEHAFSRCTSLTEIVIPDHVTDIGTYAFYGCSGLNAISIGSGVASIGEYAFVGCDNIQNVYITDLRAWCEISAEDSLLKRGSRLYLNGQPVEHAVIPDGTTGIGNYAFLYSTDLKSVVIPDSVTYIGDSAFSDCTNLSEITIPDSVVSIGAYAFSDCVSLTEMPISNSVTTIAGGTYGGCDGLTEIVIPENVTIIEDYAFTGCEYLAAVTIGSNVTRIGGSAFSGCDNLSAVYITDLASWSQIEYGHIGGGPPDHYSNPVYYAGKLYLNGELMEKVVIPDGVTTIAGSTFTNLDSMTELVIPGSVTSIGDHAFMYCDGLTQLTIPRGVTAIYALAFENCDGLTEVTIPATVTTFGPLAFGYCDNLNTITFCGDAPLYGGDIIIDGDSSDVFASVTATAYYPAGNDTWTEARMESYGGNITWVPYDAPADPADDLKFTEVTDKTFSAQYEIMDADTSGMGASSFYYSDDYFNTTSMAYNHSLGRLSLGMAMSAVTYKDHGDKYIREFLENIGCITEEGNTFAVRTVKFDSNDETDDTCAYAYGVTYLEETDTYLIPVAIRGFGYGGEWASNVHVVEDGYESYAAGFKKAADLAYTDVTAFVDQLVDVGISRSDIKIWVSGFSRAGAISNLLGARLTSDSGIPQENIFVYTFATPATVKTSAAVKYENIFNIVSEIDVVPRVPLRSWGYVRYGTTYYLPCYSTAGTMRNYVFSEASGNFKEIMTLNGSAANYIYYRDQELALDLLVDYLDDIVSSAAVYKHNGYQAALETYLEIKYSDFEGLALVGAVLRILLNDYPLIVESVMDLIETDSSMSAGEKVLSATAIIWDVQLHMLNMDPDDPARNVLTVLGELLVRYVYVNETNTEAATVYETMFSMVADLSNGFNSRLLMQHWGETYLAWMRCPSTFLETSSYKKVSVKCPVDVVVYDNNGNVVARVINDVVDETIENALSVVVNEYGEKDIYLPYDSEYCVDITAREAGELDIVVSYYDTERQHVSSTCYLELPMEAEQVFTVSGIESVVYSDGQYLEADVRGGAETFEVTLTTDLPGLAFGGGSYQLGETVGLIAADDLQYGFDGWYVDDALLSDSYAYAFTAAEDVAVEARFHEHSWDEGVVTTPADCEADGELIHTCQICGYQKSTVLPALGHSYEDGVCTVCGAVCTPGDVNEDGVIDNIDAMLVMQYTVGIIGDDGLVAQAADVDGSGSADNVDAMLIMQYAVGIITEFPSQQ